MIKKLFRNIATNSIRTTKLHFFFYNQVNKFDPSKDYYNILQVTSSSSDAEIKKSYYRLAKMYHPDTNLGKETRFKEINQAYSVLSDYNIKKQYDSSRSFQGFSRRMKDKVNQGSYSYQQYRGVYQNMSAEEQDPIYQEMKSRFTKGVILGFFLFIIIPFWTRRNHHQYMLQNEAYIPDQFQQFQGGIYEDMLPHFNKSGSYGSLLYPQNMSPQEYSPYNRQNFINSYNSYPNNFQEYQPYYSKQSNPYQNTGKPNPYRGCC